MKIAITIVHNKTDAQNEAQIQALLSLVQKITDTNPVFDDQGVQIGTFDTYHYEISALNLPHEVRFYQVVPFGVTPPPSLDLLDSYKVFYGVGDEDKTGNHPRFFNWGLKRGTDHGADISVYLADPTQLTAVKVKTALQTIQAGTDFLDGTWGKLATSKALKLIGQLDEKKTLAQAINDYKNRMTGGGLKTG